MHFYLLCIGILRLDRLIFFILTRNWSLTLIWLFQIKISVILSSDMKQFYRATTDALFLRVFQCDCCIWIALKKNASFTWWVIVFPFAHFDWTFNQAIALEELNYIFFRQIARKVTHLQGTANSFHRLNFGLNLKNLWFFRLNIFFMDLNVFF